MTHVRLQGRPVATTFNTLMDDFFNELPALFKGDFNNFDGKSFVPVNVKETEKAIVIEVVAPGFEKADFKINLENNLLTISADKKAEVSQENEKEVRREYSYRSFKRSFTIDDKTDATNIEASYINGVLTLNLPKKEAVKPPVTQITIK